MKTRFVLSVCVAVSVLLFAFIGSALAAPKGPVLTPQEQLGKSLFFDKSLSDPPGQACAACHAPDVGYTGPSQIINKTGAVYEGAVAGRFGNRKPPSAAYGGSSPVFPHQPDFVGGMFWDGRATGWTLGDPLAEQAQGPFLNPLEQNNASAQVVIDKVLKSPYKNLFKNICTDPAQYYECVGRSIAAYERSAEVSAFTSKYDYALQGKVQLTEQEAQGLALFNGKANCAACHPSEDPAGKPLFTDFTYDNLGVPRNPLNPFYYEPEWNPAGLLWVDNGLGGFLASQPELAQYAAANDGKMKVPTLRNVDKRPSPKFVKAYSHNGYFKSLEEIVHFYNTRDVAGAGWAPPEVPATVNRTELGNLGLSHAEEQAIVAFLKTLTDGYKVK
jgi:cytochrome c peroxidase